MSTGVRVVGSPGQEAVEQEAGDQAAADRAIGEDISGAVDRPVDDEEAAGAEAIEEAAGALPGDRVDGRRRARPGRSTEVRRRGRAFVVVAVVAVVGLAGTIGFGLAWAGLHGRTAGESQARASAKTFLTALTNFDAKTVDADFSAITAMATGDFAGQADKFFNSSIRQELENALASSRGQVRSLYVQSYGGGQASVYAVVDQLYVNNKISSPQSDVLRIVVDLTQAGGTWKISDVTVLTGPSLGSSAASGGSTAGTGSAPTAETGSPAGAGSDTSTPG